MRILTSRLSPSFIVAIAAVVLASSGSAIAARFITTRDIKNGTIQLVDLNAKARSALAGGRGPQGAPGPRGADGAAGPVGPAGAKGDPGGAGGGGTLPDVLPSGRTLIGAWSNIGGASGAERIGSAISFPIPLASAPSAHFVRVGGPAVTGCPGSAAAPTAAPGHLCIYEARASNVGFQSFEDPITGATGSTSRRFGINVVGFSSAAGNYISSGSWAVTAP